MSWLNRSQSRNRIFVYLNTDKVSIFAHKKLHTLSNLNEMKSFIKEEGLNKNDVTCALSRDEYELFYIDAPNVPEEEQTSAAKFLVKDLLSFPISEAALEVFKMPSVGTQPKVTVVASKLSSIESLRKTFLEFELNLTDVTIPEIALANYLEHTPGSDQTTALLYQSSTGSHMLIARSGEIQMIRDIGTPSALEEISQKEKTTLEVQRSLDFFQTALRQSAPTKIYLSWEASNPQFMTHLKQSLTQTVEPLPVLENFSDLTELSHAAVVAGLHEEAA